MTAQTMGRKEEEIKPCRHCGQDVDFTPQFPPLGRTRRDYHQSATCVEDLAREIGERRANTQ